MNKILHIRSTKTYGRGIYASRNIKKGEIVEISPVIKFKKEEHDEIVGTVLNLYTYTFGKKYSAIALGVGSLFNHSREPNLDYKENIKRGVIYFRATRAIKKGEQLFINYSYDPIGALKRHKLWREKVLR